MKNPWSLRFAVIALCSAVAVVTLPPAFADIQSHVFVNNWDGFVSQGSTVGQLLALVDVHPRSGDLISVTGRLLRRGAVPGFVEVNGARATANTLLKDNDHVVVIDGASQKEPVQRLRGPATVVGNPVSDIPVDYDEPTGQIRGTISHEVVSEVASKTTHPAIALTFDDGPTMDWTLKVLAVVKQFKIKATFFELGQYIVAFPRICAAIEAAGMPIENHSWSHPFMARLSATAQYDQMLQQIQALRAFGFPLPTWFRPPYGSYGARTVELARKLGMRTILWSDDPFDWSRPGVGTIIKRVLAQARPGGVILLHDGGGDRSQTLAALPTIIAELLRRGYRFVTLG